MELLTDLSLLSTALAFVAALLCRWKRCWTDMQGSPPLCRWVEWGQRHATAKRPNCSSQHRVI